MKLTKRLALCWRILRAEPGAYMSHADRELPHIGTDEMGQLMADQVREILLVFSTHGHSGFSAGYATDLLQKLMRFELIAPLTGEPEEWMEPFEEALQNRRASHVFKDPARFGGQAYDINAVVFREPDGGCFTGRGSGQPVTFPYTPRTVYVDVDEEGNPLDGWNREGICPAWVQGDTK